MSPWDVYRPSPPAPEREDPKPIRQMTRSESLEAERKRREADPVMAAGTDGLKRQIEQDAERHLSEEEQREADRLAHEARFAEKWSAQLRNEQEHEAREQERIRAAYEAKIAKAREKANAARVAAGLPPRV